MSSSSTIDKYKGLLLGAIAKYYYFPYNEKKSVNPFAIAALSFSPSFSLIQPRLGTGIIYFIHPYLGASGEVSIAYNHFRHDGVVFNYFGDAGFKKIY